MENKKTFKEKHPRLKYLFGLFLIIVMVLMAILVVKYFLELTGRGIDFLIAYVKKFVTTTDKVIVVAMITGAVSIVGVVISSIVAKIVDYRYNVKKYLYDKREEPYEKFIEMIYTIMEETKKNDSEKMSEEKMTKMVSEFSKGLTLWGSNRVVKKWLRYRKSSLNGGGVQTLLELEDIIYEIRKDVGQKKKLRQGDMLSLFINDVDKLIKQEMI